MRPSDFRRLASGVWVSPREVDHDRADGGLDSGRYGICSIEIFPVLRVLGGRSSRGILLALAPQTADHDRGESLFYVDETGDLALLSQIRYRMSGRNGRTGVSPVY